VRISKTLNGHDESAKLGLKGPANAGEFTRFESEWDIPVSLARYILENLRRGYLIVKTRYEVPANEPDLKWQVDVFEAENSGLVIAEIELQSEDQRIPLPDWIRPEDEITRNSRYTNAALSKNPIGPGSEAQ